MHKQGRIDFQDLGFADKEFYSPETAYAQSKLANLLFTYHLDKKVRSHGLHVAALAAHPGGATTNLGRHSSPTFMGRLLRNTVYRFLMQNAEGGALSGIRAALDPSAKSGMYFGPTGWFEASGHPEQVLPSQQALDPVTAQKLWTESESLTGVTFDFD